jgi:hypothetical protein
MPSSLLALAVPESADATGLSIAVKQPPPVRSGGPSGSGVLASRFGMSSSLAAASPMAAALARLAAWSIGRAPHPDTPPPGGVRAAAGACAPSYLARRNPSIVVIARQIPSAGDVRMVAGENPGGQPPGGT